MADSNTVAMPANNAMIEVIAPTPSSVWCTLSATGHRDIQLFVYVSGVDDTWSDGGYWALAHKMVIGDKGAFYRVPPTPYFTIRAQGPVGETCRVTVT